MSRTTLPLSLFLTAALLVGFPISQAATHAAQDPFDLIIHGGRLIDGTGNPWFWADIGIRGKKIAAVGDLSQALAARRIDAQGHAVSPGFIDMHAHPGTNTFIDPRAVSKITQGITLEIEGEGGSVAPLNDAMATRYEARLARYGVDHRWRSLDEFFQHLEANPATINFATYLGTENVRVMTVGHDNRLATPEELEQMREIVDQAMRDGALGVYSALMYSPDRYNRTSELIEMARVASAYGGLYQTHPRSEGNAFRASLDEVFRIAREARLPAHITHLKIAYEQNWGRMSEIVQRVEDARAEGLQITADMYPYEQGAASFSALLPPWALEGGREEVVRRLNDDDVRERIRRDLATQTDEWENEYMGAGGGPRGITLVGGAGNPNLDPYQGMTLDAIARAKNQDPRDTVMDLVLEDDPGFTSYINNEHDIQLAIQQPWVAFGTDGGTIAPDGPLSGGLTHPRSYGSFPKILGKYVRELGLVRLEEAVRRATSFPAQILQIGDRGLLREGFYADVVIFDPATVIDRATYVDPHQISTGIHTVVVNGEVVLHHGEVSDARPGMVVRGPGYTPRQPDPAKTSSALENQLGSIRETIERRVAEAGVPGLGVGIVRDGEVILSEGFGTRDTNTGLPIDSQTIFLIGSTTKAFTTTALAMLVDDGLVDWRAPVRTYVPTFGVHDDEYVSEHITVEDLVTHRTGVPESSVRWMGSTLSRKDLVGSIRTADLSVGFRERFQYNNAMFMAAGYVAGQVTNSTYEGLIHDRILTPLGMTRTEFTDLSEDDPPFANNIAMPHEMEDGSVRRIDFQFEGAAIRPAGTLASSLDDMLTWVLFNLSRGRHSGEELLSEPGFERLIAPHMVTDRPDRTDTFQTYGLGWFLDTYHGKRVVHHGGGSTGTIAEVLFMPDDGIGMVLFTNTYSDLPSELAYELVGLLTGSKEPAAHPPRSS